MDKKFSKNQLVTLAETIHSGERIAAGQAQLFLDHQFHEASKASKFMVKLAAAISFFFASVLVIFPEVGEKLTRPKSH